jgi:nitrogen regulatory protein P-II 2
MGVKGHSVSETRGYGRQKGHDSVYRGPKHLINYWPKWRIEIVCVDEMVDSIVQVILKSAKTGDIGDGKIFVYEIEQAYRIRTGETGIDAIKI